MTTAPTVLSMHPRPLHRWTVMAVAAIAGAASLSGCSFALGDSPNDAAARLIEGDLATQLDLGAISATCQTPQGEGPGTSFTCTSPTDQGEIHWVATMVDDSTVNVESTNLVTLDVMPKVEAEAVGALEAQVGSTLGVENFDCGDRPVVLTPERSMVCALTDPTQPGAVYDATITFTDLSTGLFDVVVATEPRT